MKDEHASVFGSDPTQAPTLMKEQPTLLNQLPYTLAVLKEVMRFYPLSGSIRMGVPDVALPDRHGTQYPTKDFHLVSIHPRLHFNPRLWPNPKEFMPERWLVGPEDPLYPRSGAWRPFEHGPRNCIGQNLSLIELRVALVMTVRTFRIEPAYEEWDAARPQGMIGNLLENLGLKDGRRELDGEMVYPIEKGGSNARDGYPCRITLLEHEK
jgi:cytochrome P450